MPLGIKQKTQIIGSRPRRESSNSPEYRLGLLLSLRFLQSNFDIIHFIGFPRKLTLLIHLLKKLRSKVIYTVNGLVCRERAMGFQHPYHFEKLERKLIFGSNHLVVVSESLKKLLLDYGADPDKITVLPNAVEKNYFVEVSPESKKQVLEKYNLNFSSKIIFTAGGTDGVKDVGFIVEAIEKLGMSEVVLLVGGRKGDQHDLFRIDRKNVKYIGILSQDEIIRLYNSCDVYIQSSRYDSFGMAPLEAMAAGSTVIVSDRVGMSYLIEHGINGFIAPYRKVDELASLIAKALENPRKAAIGEKARSTAMGTCWNNVAQSYIDIYKKI